uniref:serine hydrolase n=1 Tax=Ndongobacter massiliensis TaxID=1871025 RepID=UPI000931F1C9|nr:serine hydrolase [Ndongobacter massiliensis]
MQLKRVSLFLTLGLFFMLWNGYPVYASEEFAPEEIITEENDSNPATNIGSVEADIKATQQNSSTVSEEEFSSAEEKLEETEESNSSEMPPTDFNEEQASSVESVESSENEEKFEEEAEPENLEKETLLQPMTLPAVEENKTGWVEKDGEWIYVKPDGSTFYNQVITFGPNVAYYIGDHGQRMTGVFRDAQGNMRLTDEEGQLSLRAQWCNQGTDRYYAKGDFGKIFSDQVITFGGSVGYFMGADGKVTYGQAQASNGINYFSDYATGELVQQTGWVFGRDDERLRYYVKGRGELFSNQVITFGGTVGYYMGTDGSVQYGVSISPQGIVRYSDPTTGKLVQDAGWIEEGDKRYYAKGRGELFANQVITFGGTVGYYMGADGSVQHGHCVSPQRVHYYSDLESGELVQKPGWITCAQDGARHYVKGAGVLFANQIITFGPDVAYYMNENAEVAKGITRTAEGMVLRLDDETGQLLLGAGWLEFDGDRFYFQENGMPFRNQIITFGMENAYLMGKTGAVQYGWQNLSGNRYYLLPDGRAARGWNSFADDYFYFSPIRYFAVRGLQFTGQKYHYFDDNTGVLRTGKVQSPNTSVPFVYVSLKPESSELSGQGLGRSYDAYCADEAKTAKARAAEAAVLRYFSSYGGSASLYYNEVETGLNWILNDKPQYPASVIKTVVMAAVYDRINRGEIRNNGVIENQIHQMITVSNNSSYNYLVYLMGDGNFARGCARIREFAERNGYYNTYVRHTLHPSGYAVASNGGGWNSMTAEDAGLQMRDIYLGRLVSPYYSERMTGHLLQQVWRNKIPKAVGSGIRVANKTGYADQSDGYGYSQDMAIVYRPNNPYILSVFVYKWGLSDPQGEADCCAFARVVHQNY